jgi:hypothetical protein
MAVSDRSIGVKADGLGRGGLLFYGGRVLVSFKVTNWVWENATQRDGEFKLLLALAYFCDDEGQNAYPSMKLLASRTRLTLRHVRRIINNLKKTGALVVTHRQPVDRGSVHTYCIPMAGEDIVSSLSPLERTSQPLREDIVSPLDFLERTSTPPREDISAVSEALGRTSAPPLTLLNINQETIRETCSGHTSLGQNGMDNGVDPDWYVTLKTIRGFDRELSQAKAWLDTQAITEDDAYTTSLALKGRWDGKKYHDPWATFQNWCRMDKKRHAAIAKPKRGDEKYAELEEQLNGRKS